MSRLAAHFGVIGDVVPAGLVVFEIELPRIDIDYLEMRPRLCETILGAYHWVSLGPPRPIVIEPEQGMLMRPRLLLKLRRHHRDRRHIIQLRTRLLRG